MNKLSNYITVYHGDDYNTTSLNPKLMNNGNNQEGIGIYFGNTLEIAKTYGKNIVKAIIDPKKFVDSRTIIKRVIKNSDLNKLLKELYKLDSEEMWYLLTDYGVEISEPDDVTESNINLLLPLINDEEIRNFQIDMAERFGVENFVKIWNKIFSNTIHGTYNKGFGFYCIINTKIKVKKMEEGD